MKIRAGFVTNSSSSSYIVIDASKGYDELCIYDDNGVFTIGPCGESEFGWKEEEYHLIYDRINFSYLQALYRLIFDGEVDWINMIEEVILENSDARRIVSQLSTDYDDRDKDDKIYGYIDHQSAYGEGENTEMFASKQTLKDFIFGKDSYIHGDNDNH